MPSFVAVAGAALLLPGAVLGAAKPMFPDEANHALMPNFGCNILGVTEYFAKQYPVPAQCQDYNSDQVTNLCNEYLTLVRTVYTTTVTPVVTRTSFFTVQATTTTTTTSISTAVATSVSTSVSTSLTTTTQIITNADEPHHTGHKGHTGSFARRDRGIAAAPPPGCSDITRDSFLSHPDFMIKVACKCLPIRFTTISTASTAKTTRTSTVSSTATLSFTVTSSTTTTTCTTTTTTTTTTTSSTSTTTFTVPTPIARSRSHPDLLWVATEI